MGTDTGALRGARRPAPRVISALVGAALALFATGCTGGTMPDDSRRPLPTTSRGPIDASPTPSGAPSAVTDARWDAIEADLAARGVTAAPSLVSAESITWPNGALGCPQPGEAYTQALVDGMRVVVDAGGATYDYRFGRGDTPRLCE